MIKDYLSQAQQELEGILNEEIDVAQNYREELITEHIKQLAQDWKVVVSRDEMRGHLEGGGLLTHMRNDSPYIIGRGEHQIVIGLNNGLVAKTHYRGTEEFVEIGRRPFNFTRETKEHLLELGIETPEMHFCRFYWQDGKLVVDSDVFHESRTEMWINLYLDVYHTEKSESDKERGPNICITQDLREGGRYTVVDYDEKVVRSLVNGSSLLFQFENLYETLNGLEETVAEGLVLEYEPHLVRSPRTEGTRRDEAIKKMFLVQVPKNPKEEGKLVVGDIDHVYVYESIGGGFRK